MKQKKMQCTTQKDSDFINIQKAANEIRYGDFRLFSEYAHKGKVKLYIMPQNPDKQVSYRKVRSSYLEIIVNDSDYPDYIDKLKHNKGTIKEEWMYLKDENGEIIIYEPPKEILYQIPIKWVPKAITLDDVYMRVKDLLQLKEECEKERYTSEEDKLTMARPAIKKNKEVFVVGTKDKVITPESEGVRLKKLRENNNANVSTTMQPIPRKHYKLEDLLYGKIETKSYFKIYADKARNILINKDQRILEEAITWAYLMMRWHWDRGSGEFKRSQICTDLLQTEGWLNPEMLIHAYDFCKEELNMLVEKSQYSLSENENKRKRWLEQAMKLSKVEYLAVFILVKIADALGRNETSDKDVSHAYSKILELEVKENSVKPMAVNMVEHSLQKNKLTQNNINVPKISEKNLVKEFGKPIPATNQFISKETGSMNCAELVIKKDYKNKLICIINFGGMRYNPKNKAALKYILYLVGHQQEFKEPISSHDIEAKVTGVVKHSGKGKKRLGLKLNIYRNRIKDIIDYQSRAKKNPEELISIINDYKEYLQDEKNKEEGNNSNSAFPITAENFENEMSLKSFIFELNNHIKVLQKEVNAMQEELEKRKSQFISSTNPYQSIKRFMDELENGFPVLHQHFDKFLLYKNNKFQYLATGNPVKWQIIN
ncbi:MAG: hypothetical protein AMJ43_04065 [Coxiella sp. DG_40]|nr:MAG: hypothetical protein AMJ43_04065 [Coxiella sp. DG_40]